MRVLKNVLDLEANQNTGTLRKKKTYVCVLYTYYHPKIPYINTKDLKDIKNGLRAP